jgi:glycosyl transferase family 25
MSPTPNAGELLTLVINLDRSPQRWQRVSAQLHALGLAYERLPAVDARAFTPEQQAQLDVPGFHRLHGMEPLGGELGCYLSHVKVMQRLLASPAQYALVLEDDVTVTERLPAALAGLLAHPQRWDMVKLSAVHSGTPQPVLQVAPGQQLAVMLSRCTGSSAYLVNRRAAQAYVQGLLPMRLPYDHVFDRGWQFGLKVRLLTPTPCVHGEDDAGASTILGSGGGRRPKFAWHRRLPTYAFRMGASLRRLAYGLQHWALARWAKG